MAKENQADLDSILDVAMKEAEQFCAIVVQQLNTNQDSDTNDDWHSGQLHAYSSATQRMFETTAEEQSNAAQGNVRRQLNELWMYDVLKYEDWTNFMWLQYFIF